MKSPIEVSLVTTVLNDRAGMSLFLFKMMEQTHLPAEIVVVDGGSRDGTWELLEEAALRMNGLVVALQEKGCNVARGRNLAVEAAKHEVVVSTDVGCDWDPEWLLELATPLSSAAEIELVVGSWGVRLDDMEGPWAKTELALRGDCMECSALPDSQITTRSVAFRKAMWLRLGGLPEDLTLAADDLVFDKLVKATGVRTASAPQIRCYWHRHTTLRGFRKETSRYFFGNGEAGVTMDHFILVGGRMVSEVLLLAAGGFGLFFTETFGFAFGCMILVGLSICARARHWIPAARRLRAMGVNRPFWRVASFEMIGRIDAVRSYVHGWLRGRTHCRACRARLRAVNAH